MVDLPQPDPAPPDRIDVAVIGAGIVGVSAAAYLRARGREVVVIDREGVAAGTSQGNAGCVALSQVAPLAVPGVLRQVPRWLLDPLGPLAVPPAYAPRMLPWLARFCRSATPRAAHAAGDALAALNRLARDETPALMERAAAATMLRSGPMLYLYHRASALRASSAFDRQRHAAGVDFEHLRDPAAIAAIQPGLAPRFKAATLVANDFSVGDPRATTRAVAAHALASGAAIARGAVTRLAPGDQGIRLSLTGGAEVTASQVIVAAGAWSRPLAQSVGDAIPLESERGYNTTLPEDAVELRANLTFADHGFIVSRLATGVRVGGAVEFGGLDRPPDYRRADAMLTKAKRFLPALRTEGGSQWMGHRPSLPDSLPVIGPASADPRIIYAYGHGHLGLTQSAATGRVVADLVTGAPPPIDLAPFRPGRFRGRAS